MADEKAARGAARVVRLGALGEGQAEVLAHGGHEIRRQRLGRAAGSRALGVSHVEIPPGKKGWPYHWHSANEEAIYVLEGEGVLRLGGERVPIGPGSYAALPVGPDHAHQVINTGAAPLRYLAISTMNPVDVVACPDSNKLCLYAGAAPGGAKEARFLSAILRADAEVGYWEGEG